MSEIGQTKKNSISASFEAETKLKSKRYPMIVLPRKVLDEIYRESGTNLMKIRVRNDDMDLEYFWEYDPTKKPYLVFKELNQGRYMVEIAPYTLKDFLR